MGRRPALTLKRPKYGNRRTKLDGYSFASKAEARRYSELKLLVQARVIQGLALQPRFRLVVGGRLIATYVGDFLYLEKLVPPFVGTDFVIEDVKGYRTREYKIKAKLFQALYPLLTFREIPA